VKHDRVLKAISAEDGEHVAFLETPGRETGPTRRTASSNSAYVNERPVGPSISAVLSLNAAVEAKMKSVIETSGIATSGYGPRKIIKIWSAPA